MIEEQYVRYLHANNGKSLKEMLIPRILEKGLMMPKRFTLIIVATLVLLLLLVIFKPYTGIYDKELSNVEDVSLKRIRSDGRSSSYSSGGNKLEYSGGTLQDILAVLTNDSYPIIELTDLPKGYYSINSEVDGDVKELSKKVYDALSGAFNLKVSVRPILVDSYILTCPNPQALTIHKSDEKQSHGFYKHTATGGSNNTTDFIDTVDSIAWIAGYFTRKTFTGQEMHALRDTAFVNETGLDGLYEGRIDWSLQDLNVIMDSLKSMGFTITKDKRTVEAVVIELPVPDKSSSELPATLPNGQK